MHRHLLAPIALCIVCVGCSDDSLPSRGTVVFDDGQPVQSGSIEFRARNIGRRYASRIGPKGGFQLLDQDGEPGIEPGEYEVVVVQIVLTEDLAKADHTHGRTVPRRYADYYTSDLRSEIKSDHQGLIEVVLKVE